MSDREKPVPNEGPNREQRRAERFGREHARRSDSRVEPHEQELTQARTPQDVTDVRAKSQGHGKKTADKWNQ